MANTFFFLSSSISDLSQAPIKESKTQFSGSTGIYSSGIIWSASCESFPSAGNPAVTNLLQDKETPFQESRAKQSPKQGTLTPGLGLPQQAAAACVNQLAKLANQRAQVLISFPLAALLTIAKRWNRPKCL